MRPFPDSVFVAAWLLHATYIFGLPNWAEFANNKYSQKRTHDAPKGLCQLKGTDMACLNGQNLTQLLLDANRSTLCSCGEGFFGEAICPLQAQDGYSISAFISTPFATGSMAVLSALPILGMYRFMQLLQEDDRVAAIASPCLLAATYFTFYVFVFFWGLFLVCTTCLLPNTHNAVVLVFIVALVAHFALLAQTIRTRLKDSFLAFLTLGLLAVAVLSLLLGMASRFIFERYPTWWWPWGFWLGECMGLSVGFGLTPVIAIYDGYSRCDLRHVANADVENLEINVEQRRSRPRKAACCIASALTAFAIGSCPL